MRDLSVNVPWSNCKYNLANFVWHCCFNVNKSRVQLCYSAVVIKKTDKIK